MLLVKKEAGSIECLCLYVLGKVRTGKLNQDDCALGASVSHSNLTASNIYWFDILQTRSSALAVGKGCMTKRSRQSTLFLSFLVVSRSSMISITGLSTVYVTSSVCTWSSRTVSSQLRKEICKTEDAFMTHKKGIVIESRSWGRGVRGSKKRQRQTKFSVGERQGVWAGFLSKGLEKIFKGFTGQVKA